MNSHDLIPCTAPEIGAQLLSYGLGTLNEADTAAFEEHLIQCPACQEELAGSSRALKALAGKRADLVEKWKSNAEDFESRHDLLGKSSDTIQQKSARYRNRTFYWVGTAAACLLLFVLWQVNSSRESDDVTNAMPETTRRIAERADSIMTSDTTKIISPQTAVKPKPDVRSLATRAPLAYVFITPRGGTASTAPEGFEDAMRLYTSGKYADAVRTLNSISDRSPGDSEVLLYLGMSRYMLGDFNGAIRALDAAEKSQPRTTRLAQVRWYRANSHVGLNKPEEALPDLGKVAASETDYAKEAESLVNRLKSELRMN